MIGRPPGEEHDELHEEAQVDLHLQLHQAWEQALASLERDVAVAEQVLAGAPDLAPAGATPWQPPLLGGPVPDALVGRARDLVRRQAAVRAGLGRAVEQSRTDLAQLRSRSAGGVLSPAYVDISA